MKDTEEKICENGGRRGVDIATSHTTLRFISPCQEGPFPTHKVYSAALRSLSLGHLSAMLDDCGHRGHRYLLMRVLIWPAHYLQSGRCSLTDIHQVLMRMIGYLTKELWACGLALEKSPLSGTA